jgi:DNA adenine methylase
LNGSLTTFWSVVAHPPFYLMFIRKVGMLPFDERLWRESSAAVEYFKDNPPQTQSQRVQLAAAFFVACRQSLAGRMDSFTGITRTRTRRGMNNEVSAWISAVEGLDAVHDRLKRVLILNRPAIQVITNEDTPKTLFYLDPPYLHETRKTTKEYGPHEMGDADHAELLYTCGHMKGKFLLSGYRSKMYDAAAEKWGWHRTDFDLPNNAAGGKTKRRMTECVWTNFEPDNKEAAT